MANSRTSVRSSTAVIAARPPSSRASWQAWQPTLTNPRRPRSIWNATSTTHRRLGISITYVDEVWARASRRCRVTESAHRDECCLALQAGHEHRGRGGTPPGPGLFGQRKAARIIRIIRIVSEYAFTQGDAAHHMWLSLAARHPEEHDIDQSDKRCNSCSQSTAGRAAAPGTRG
jgi:hypothetical protein